MSTILVQPETTTSTWVIDRVHSTSQFKVKHMMISNVLGEFTSITGVLERDENDITKSKIRASIDADTINTREPQRDAQASTAPSEKVSSAPATAHTESLGTLSTDGELAGCDTTRGRIANS